MGIELHLEILPHRITPEGWASVYQETLKVLEHFDFMDIVEGKYGMSFAARTQHRENLLDGYGGWRSGGDLVTGWNTETFYFADYIDFYRNRCDKDNGRDILLIRAHGVDDVEPPDTAVVFGGKTQGEHSQIPLLAVGCLVAHRLPNAALVFGDITDGQCQEAVQWANSFLDEPIDVPCTADMTRLVPRLLSAGLPDDKVLDLIFWNTLQARDAAMGTYLREQLTPAQISGYYAEQLLYQRYGEEGWRLSTSELREYLELGFDFRELCRIILTDPQRRQDPEGFLNTLLHMKLHIEIDKKNLFDIAADRMETGDRKRVGSVSDQLFRVMAMLKGAGNRNVNAYIPLKQIRRDMLAVLGEERFGERFDVIAAEYTGDPADSAQAVLYDDPGSGHYLDSFPGDRELPAEPEKEYDITNHYQVIEYRPGLTIRPDIRARFEESLAKISSFAGACFPEFTALDREGRIRWFQRALEIPIPEDAMDDIVDKIMDDAFIRRYVCLCSVELNSKFVKMVVRSFLWNKVLLSEFWGGATKRAADGGDAENNA